MANLEWNHNSNLEDSFIDFLRERIEGDSGDTPLTVFYQGEELPVNVRVGFPESSEWTLPVISLYEQSTNRPRLFVGTSDFKAETLIIIDIRALNDRMRSDLATWVANEIKGGFPFYEYAPNPADPENPVRTFVGNTIVNFQSDRPIRLENVDVIDLYRHQMTVSVIVN